jgi:hypothetical protein
MPPLIITREQPRFVFAAFESLDAAARNLGTMR